MATPAGPPPSAAGPPTQKISDVITSFRPNRRFKSGGSTTAITSLDFDDTGELAIVARNDDTLQIYNCKEGKHAKELKSQKYGVHLARFSHHAQSIIYASTKVDDTIRFLSTHDNSYIRYFKGHTDTVTSISLCPSSDSFISCSRDNTVRIWNLQSNHYQGLLNLHAPYLAAYDPSATVIAIASPPTHSILLYDIRNYDKPPFATFDLQDLEQRFLAPGGGGEWTKLEFTNDGKSLIVGTTGVGHFVLDAFSGEIKHFCYRKSGHSGRLAPGQAPSIHSQSSQNGNMPAAGQGDLCATPDGQFLVGGSGDEGLLVWNIAKPPTSNHVLECMDVLPGPGKGAIVGYNPRTNLLASADKDLFFWQPDADLMV
ncbi:WD repeat-containing protein-like protein [Delitschia confertaspora ATCC 74209]|uniref:WD repeat-containing protein-like protein n=1 Tax=Delitschia confertaspora ATCC 74209 TaxID=1513339 RepID=A0A9P4MP86_9PLEO|nr:WD repeat-containing protein-like protein [Delitschia confertaspora ATCC 74209]